MKRFLIRCTAFGLLILVLAIVADVALSYKGRHSDMRNLKLWNEWYGKDDAYDIVINGSSRGMVQYDPRILDSALNTKSFNLSINGSHINRHIFKYKIFRKTHPKPKLIIQNFESYTMSNTMGYDTWQF